MRAAFLFLSFLALSFVSYAESIRIPKEDRYPEIPKTISETQSPEFVARCAHTTSDVYRKSGKSGFFGPLENNIYWHKAFWNNALSLYTKDDYSPLSETEVDRVIEYLKIDPRDYDLKDKSFLANKGLVHMVNDEEFLHRFYYDDCNQKMTIVISDYLPAKASVIETGGK